MYKKWVELHATLYLWRGLLQKLEISYCLYIDTIIYCWKSYCVSSYLTAVLFYCKCIFFVGLFQKNLPTDPADESIKLKWAMYNYITWVSLIQYQIYRNHNSSMNGVCYRKKYSWKFLATSWIIETVTCL